jgi:hypothetical protein
MALMEPDARVLAADGRRAEGAQAVRELVSDFLSGLRSTAHRITAQWHHGEAWIAEADATYDLGDGASLGPLARAFVVRTGSAGIADVRVYGAHERSLPEQRRDAEGIRVGGRWIPAL